MQHTDGESNASKSRSPFVHFVKSKLVEIAVLRGRAMRLRRSALSQDEAEFLFRYELATAEFRYGASSGEVGLVLLMMLEHSRATGAGYETTHTIESRINDIVRYYERACTG